MASRLIETPAGQLFVATTSRGVRRIEFRDTGKRRPKPDTTEDQSEAATRLLERACRQIDEYFGGERRDFDLPLDLAGTDFQRRVWLALAAIPFGETRSYGGLAGEAGAANAYRAVGAACGANPIVIVVPCHRVIGSDGGLHGFGGGLDLKAWLLRHEGVTVRTERQAELVLA
jgi:methylated-DNA-[protein]-cysteine S-methyltransferase